jgi:hypothetical protein
MSHISFEKGETFPTTDIAHARSGIHVSLEKDLWDNRIEIYGETIKDSQQLRDIVLDVLQQYFIEEKICLK